MATGLTKGERNGLDALVASTHAAEPNALPLPGSPIEFAYANKLEESEVLRPLRVDFLTLDRMGRSKKSKNLSPNTFVLSNNIYALNAALKTLKGNVKLIYTDPPYGTGLGFQSRELAHAYDDRSNDSSYIEFMRRRLIICRELLAEDGSIYLHIGHQMVAEMKILLDEVFGRSNFRNIIARRKCSSKNSTRKSYPNLLDFVLFYSKTNKYKFNQPAEQPSEEWLVREYPKQDEKGRYKLVPVHAPGVRKGATGSEWRGKLPPPGKHWQYTPARLDELDASGDMHWSSTGNPRRKVYFDAERGLPLTDYWPNYRDAHHQSVRISGYPTEKNLEMVRQIVRASSDPGDIVLDPFCGSGTTLHAANDLGRRWIGLDQSLAAAEASIRRLRVGLTEMGDYVEKERKGRRARAHEQEIDFDFLVDEEFFRAHPVEVSAIARIIPDSP